MSEAVFPHGFLSLWESNWKKERWAGEFGIRKVNFMAVQQNTVKTSRHPLDHIMYESVTQVKDLGENAERLGKNDRFL